MAWYDFGLMDFAKKPYKGGSPTNYYGNEDIQKYLPAELRWLNKDKTYTPFGLGMTKGAANFGELMGNPGGLGSNVAGAIAPRLSMEQEMINRNTSGQQQSAAGAAARSGTAGGGMAQALAASIQQAGAREKATSLRTAMTDSAKLRREDMDKLLQMYNVLFNYSEQARKYNQKNKEMFVDAKNKAIGSISSLGSAVAGAFG